MGGTLGAILGILLSAFTSALRESAQEEATTVGVGGGDRTTTTTTRATSATFAAALEQAVAALKTHTSAREGDRTVMDVLLPFAAAFAAGSGGGAGATTKHDFHGAVAVAREKAEATKYLKAKFGRATYVAEAQGQELPDPGAWALYEWLGGMSRAIKGFQ